MSLLLSSLCRCGRRVVAGLLLPLAAGCSLSATEVEPGLPGGRVSGGNTVVYRANGLPVLAHNDSSFGTILISVLGDGRPVRGRLDAANTLTIRADDNQNEVGVGSKRHGLWLELPAFRGADTYRLSAPGTRYQETTETGSPQVPAPNLPFALVPGTTPQLTVTDWDPATRRVQGTFVLTFAPAGPAPRVTLSDGRFDVILD